MWGCSSVALEQNKVHATLAALLVHSQSCRIKSRVKLNCIWFRLVVVHRFTVNMQCRSGFVFLMCFLKLRLLCVPMQFLGQFMSSDSGSSALCTRSHHWTVQYSVPNWKMNLVETYLTLWQNAVQVLYKKIQCKTLEQLCVACRLRGKKKKRGWGWKKK